MNVSRSSALVFAASVGATIVGSLGNVYFARVLGSELIGTFFLFQALLTMFVVGTDLGVGTAVEKQMSGEYDRSAVFSTALTFYLTNIGIVTLLVLLFASQINEYVGADVAILLVLAVGAKQLNKLTNNALKGELRVGEVSGPMLVDRVGQVLIAAVLLTLGFGVKSLMYSVIIGAAGSFVWVATKLDTSVTRPTVDRFRSLFGFAKYNFIPTIGLRIHNWMDVIIIGLLMTQSDVGAYEVAWKISAITTILASSIGTTILPQVSSWDVESERSRIENLLTKALTPSIALIFPAFFGVLVLAPEILRLVFGPEFAIASLALVVLVAGKVPEAVQGLVGRCLLAMDEPALVARATVWTIVLNLVLNVILIMEFGLLGAAIATTVAYTVGLGFRVRYLSSLVDFRVQYRAVGWCLVSSVGMYAVLVAVTSWTAIDTVPKLTGIVILGAICYAALLSLFGELRSQMVLLARRLSPG